MISANDFDNISSLLSNVFFYGFSHGYSSSTIEEKILKNTYISDLESGDSSFLIRETSDRILKSFFELNVTDDDLLKTNPLSLWLGEVYTKIFFTFNKSFSFIFLYLPLSKLEEMFDLYHEMDFSQILNYFSSLEKKDSILRLLLKKRRISAKELSALTGINFNTIVTFTRDNKFIYNAKFDSIYKISQILKVNINLFTKNINNYSDSSMFEFDKTNVKYRSYLGLNLASYFSTDLEKREYVFNEEINQFTSGTNILKTFFTSIRNDADDNESLGLNEEIKDIVDGYAKTVPSSLRKNHILVIFEYNQTSVLAKSYLSLLNYGFEKVFIINSKNVICIGEQYWIGFITDTIKNAMINRAKKEYGRDFAI